MVLSLIRQASAAEDDASALLVFSDDIPVRDLEIDSDVQCLLEIAAALREVEEELRFEYARTGHIPARLQEDVDLIQRNIEQTHLTLDRELFQQTASTRYGGRIPYQMLWDELDGHFRREGCALNVRLEIYSTFLRNIIIGLRRGATNMQLTHRLRERLTRLSNHQSSLTAGFDRLRIQEPTSWDLPSLGPPRPPSRPGLPNLQTFPPYALPGPATRRYEVPPPAPEVDSSPTFTTVSEQTWSSWSSTSPNDDDSQAHWAIRIFDRASPMTYFNDPGAPTRCYGRPEPQAREMLRADRFLEVLRVPLRDTSHFCRFFWRPNDHRARILISSRDSQGRTLHRCCPLTALKLVRRVSRLSLNRYDPNDRRYMIWATLHFPTYEHQVLFYCAFVALKRQDSEPSPRRMDDYFPGEIVEFTGEVEDDSYLHKLTIFRDTDTDAIRLEASPRRGPMVGTPIWTAFITEYIGSRRWIRHVASTVIELESLQPYVFCHEYSPPRVHRRFRLNFTTPTDANNFILQFRRL